MNNYKINYYEYLKKRSIIGLLYRKYILYPSICKHLNGHVLDIGCGIGDFLKFRANTVGIEISRVLKQNGKLLVGVPGIKGYKRDPDHKIFYDLQKLIKLMNHNNLSYITHFYQPIIFANLSKIISQHSLYSIFVLGD